MIDIAPDALATWQVLIVEDAHDNAELVERLLTHFGAQVVITKNGAEALDQLSETSYTVILCDLSMPEVDGWTFVRQMQASHPQPIPVIALTAHAAVTDREKVLQAGFTGYYSKPVVDVLDLVRYMMSIVQRNS